MTKNIIHENYNGMTLTNDIALLQVRKLFLKSFIFVI